MSDSKNSSAGLLVLRYPMILSEEQADRLTEVITPAADALGVEPLVLDAGADARLEFGSSALLERLCVAVERLVQQGEPPATPEHVSPVLNARQPSEHEIAQALSRPTGLNSRAHIPPVRSPDPFRYESDEHHG